MELRRYASLLWRWLWLIALSIIVAGGIGFLISINTPRVYEASTTLLINQAPIGASSPNFDVVLTSQSLARTYSQVLRSRPVLENVVQSLKLTISPENLAKAVDVNVIRDTQLMVLTVQDTDDARASAVANEIVSEFSKQNQERQAKRYTDSEQTLQTELNSIQTEMSRTQDSINVLAGKTGASDLTERGRLETSLTQYRTSYATLLGNLEDVRRAEAQSTNNIDVVEQAQPEGVLVRPKTLNNVVLGALLGLLIATGIVFLRDYLDDTVKSSEEVERITDAPALGLIATIDAAKPSGKVVTIANARSPIAEAYRVLRTNIEFSEVDSPFRKILISSSGPSEGKTTTLANLAAAIAGTGKRVIAVDTDLRKPTLHKYFDLPNTHGVTTALLEHGGKISDHLCATATRNLLIMPSGPLPPNPAELIGSQRMEELIEELQSHAEVVLFDSPPLLVVADGALLARQCDAALLVVLAGSTRKDNLRKSKDQLVQSGTRLLGFVLNRVSTRGGGYSYYYSYGVEQAPKRPWQRASRAGAGVDNAQPSLSVTPPTHNGNGNGNHKNHKDETREVAEAVVLVSTSDRSGRKSEK